MTYQQAKKAAKANPGILYTGDAGNGCVFEVYFCVKRGRVISTCVTPNGVRIL